MPPVLMVHLPELTENKAPKFAPARPPKALVPFMSDDAIAVTAKMARFGLTDVPTALILGLAVLTATLLLLPLSFLPSATPISFLLPVAGVLFASTALLLLSFPAPLISLLLSFVVALFAASRLALSLSLSFSPFTGAVALAIACALVVFKLADTTSVGPGGAAGGPGGGF